MFIRSYKFVHTDNKNKNFKVKTSKTLLNIITTKSYETKKTLQTTSQRPTVQTPTEHVLRSGGVGMGGGRGGM